MRMPAESPYQLIGLTGSLRHRRSGCPQKRAVIDTPLQIADDPHRMGIVLSHHFRHRTTRACVEDLRPKGKR